MTTSTTTTTTTTTNAPLLFEYTIRLHRKDSAFFYFQLEANEGIAFYSTLPTEDPHAIHRDIYLCGDLLLKDNIRHLIDFCRERFPIEIVSEK